jgi:hypothetical protein
LYLDKFVVHILHSNINNFQVNNILWSDFNLIQSSSSNNDDENLAIQHISFQGYKEENNSCTIVTHESHVCLPSSSFVIQNIDLVWNLERDMIFSHVIDNTAIFHYKRMLMFELHRERQNEKMSNAYYCPLRFNIDEIYLKITFSIQSSFYVSNQDPLMPYCDYNSDKKLIFLMKLQTPTNLLSMTQFMIGWKNHF